MPKIPSRPALGLSGKWAVVELPTLPPDYLARTPDPHVLIRHEAFHRFTATYPFGTRRGEIDCGVDEVWPAGYMRRKCRMGGGPPRPGMPNPGSGLAAAPPVPPNREWYGPLSGRSSPCTHSATTWGSA